MEDRQRSEWPAKQPADITSTPIELSHSVLNRIQGNEIQQISLPGPGNQNYTASIHRVLRYGNGEWSAIGNINGNIFNSFILSYSSSTDKMLASIKVPGDHSFFELRFDSSLNQHILVKKDPHQTDELICGHNDQLTVGNENSSHQKNQSNLIPSEDHGPSTIDIMIVYTPNAQNWANVNSSGIDNIINQSMAVAQLIADNSQLDVNFNLVHSQLIEYQETGDSETDLQRLTASPSFNPWGSQNSGYMDEVHQIRDEYAADLVALFTVTADVGGVAWITNRQTGLPQYGFSISRVQQAAGPTHAHEMGHNFGNAHSRNQVTNAAESDGGLFEYSTGWRWNGTNGVEYSSVMTYSEGATEVPIFSNPDINHQGIPTGSYEGEFAPADNSRSMREMRHTIEEYRTLTDNFTAPTVFTSPVSGISFSLADAGGNVTIDGGALVTERGICWDEDPNPDFSDQCVDSDSGTGIFQARIENLNQNTDYYVRAYATNVIGTSFGSQQIFTTRSLQKPTAFFPADVDAVSFTAKWSNVPDAERYFLDVATNSGFSSFVAGFDGREIEGAPSFPVTGLSPGREYFFRVRSGAETTQSDNSNAKQIFTLDVSADNSEVDISRNRVLATGVQESLIMVNVENSAGETLEGIEVIVQPESGSSTISPIQGRTDANGIATFSITNTTEETVRYKILAAGLPLSEEVEIEFLFSDGELALGNNYPNPYNNQTIIPIVVPAQTRVRLDVYNSVGSIIQTLLDDEFTVGYYEIPFNASGLASGVYFYRMVTNQGVRVEKMLLAK